MNTYKITSTAAVAFGIFAGRNREEAINAFHVDAGYESTERAADECDCTVEQLRADLIVEEIEMDVEKLRDESGEAGDLEMVAICDRALAGNPAALVRCAEVVNDARAMCDE